MSNSRSSIIYAKRIGFCKLNSVHRDYVSMTNSDLLEIVIRDQPTLPCQSQSGDNAVCVARRTTQRHPPSQQSAHAPSENWSAVTKNHRSPLSSLGSLILGQELIDQLLVDDHGSFILLSAWPLTQFYQP